MAKAVSIGLAHQKERTTMTVAQTCRRLNRGLPMGRFALIALLLLSTLRGVAAGAPWTYRGFSIDPSHVAAENVGPLRAAVQEQIDIVCAVGLPPKILALLRTVSLRLVPQAADESPGSYSDEHRIVELRANLTTFVHHGVLLHELMHALHHLYLSGGFENRDIAFYFENAEAKGVYSGYMLQDRKEFFACAATVYLYGISGKEPFTRQKLRENQPRFFAYLSNLFGPEAGHYDGSLATGLQPTPTPSSKEETAAAAPMQR